MNTICARTVGALAMLCGCAAAQAFDTDARDAYAYQRSESVRAPLLRLDVGAATATRDAGAFAGEGLQGEARLSFSPAAHWVIETRAAALDDRITRRSRQEWGGELRYDFGSIDDDAAVWQIGAGWRRDFDGVSIPFLRLGANGYAGGWHLAAGATLEHPGAPGRDANDAIVSFGASHAAWRGQLGIELTGEDLEGLSDPEEAEGGAKFILGPTWAMHVAGAGRVRLSAGWLHALTANAPQRAGFADYRTRRDGFVGRLNWSFGR